MKPVVRVSILRVRPIAVGYITAHRHCSRPFYRTTYRRSRNPSCQEMLMRLLWLALAICFCISATSPDTSAAIGRRIMPLDAGWRFHRGDVAESAKPGFDDAGWDKVTLPHSFNG